MMSCDVIVENFAVHRNDSPYCCLNYTYTYMLCNTLTCLVKQLHGNVHDKALLVEIKFHCNSDG